MRIRIEKNVYEREKTKKKQKHQARAVAVGVSHKVES